MNPTRLEGYLGLARRSGRYALGETALDNVSKGKARLVIVAGDAAAATRARLVAKCQAAAVPLHAYGAKSDLGRLFGKTEVAVLAINDTHLAYRIIQVLKEEQHEQ